jgi:ATP-dependent Clp protease ATP-binding subunit ClpB
VWFLRPQSQLTNPPTPHTSPSFLSNTPWLSPPLHLLASLLEDPNGAAGSILTKAGFDPRRVGQLVQAELRRLPTVSGTQPQAGQALMQILSDADREARTLKDSYVSTEHLLLALAEVRSPAKEVLSVVGADRKRLLAAVEAIRKAGGRTIAEHEKTCVVYGMPRAAIELGVVDLVLPLPQIAGAIVDAVARKPLAAV